MGTWEALLIFASLVALAVWIDRTRMRLVRRCMALEARIDVLEAHDHKLNPVEGHDQFFIAGRLARAEKTRSILRELGETLES